jgi:hypothetical protein
VTDPALSYHLRILEAKLDRLTAAIEHAAGAIERLAETQRLQPVELAHLPEEGA